MTEQKQVAKAKEGKSNGKLTWGEVQMMKYTWRVAQELMRMTPPVLGNFKCAWRDTSFGGFDIPKGWQVGLSTQFYTQKLTYLWSLNYI